MKWPSASSAEAFVRCSASHVLPQHESYGNEAQASGNAGHELLCAHYNKVPGARERLETALPGLAEKLAELTEGVMALSAEDAFVVNVEKRTSQHLGRNIGRQYEKALGRKLEAFEVCCSLDLKGRDMRQRPWLRDFKFGVTASWWQLYIQAMALVWLPGVVQHEVDAGFIFIEDHDSHVTVTEDTATLYLVDLDQRADEMMEAFTAAMGLDAGIEDSLRTVEGKWCTYCGAFPHCPSKWKLAKSMLSLDVVDNVAALTAEQCGDAWLKLAEIKKNIVKKTEEALKARMRAEGGFPLADGKMLKVLPMPGRLGFDKDGAIELLKKLGAPKKEIVALIKRGESFDTVRKVNQ